MALYCTLFGVLAGSERYLRMRCAASLAAAGLDSAVSTIRGRWTNSLPCCEEKGDIVSYLPCQGESARSRVLFVWAVPDCGARCWLRRRFSGWCNVSQGLRRWKNEETIPFHAAELPPESHRDSPVRFHLQGLWVGLAFVGGSCVWGREEGESVLERRLLSERRKPFMAGIPLGVSVLG